MKKVASNRVGFVISKNIEINLYIKTTLKNHLINLAISLLISLIPLLYHKFFLMSTRGQIYYILGFIPSFFFSYRLIEYLQTGKHIHNIYYVDDKTQATLGAIIDLIIILCYYYLSIFIH